MRIKTVETLDSPVLIEFVMRMVHKTTAAKKFPIIGSVTIENSDQWYEIALDFNTASIGAFIGSAMTEWDITFYPQTAHITLEYIGIGKKYLFWQNKLRFLIFKPLWLLQFSLSFKSMRCIWSMHPFWSPRRVSSPTAASKLD